MVLKVFSIFDIKSELFNTPFFMVTRGEAVRAFKDLVNDRATTVGRHPDDYRLMCIGTFDNESGTFAANDCDSLGFGSDYLNLPSESGPAIKAV